MPTYILSLEGLRGLAIFLVLFGHARESCFSPKLANTWDFNPLQIGWTGVELFFVLSGFLITSGLIKTVDHPYYFRNFYIRRILRTFPLYYFYLFVSLVLLPIFLKENLPANFPVFYQDQIYFWTHSANIAMGLKEKFYPFGFSIFWSLSQEEQLYLFLPILIYFLRGSNLLKFFGFTFIASFILKVILREFTNHSLLIYLFPVVRWDGMIAGAAVAVLMQSEEGRKILGRLLPLVKYVSLLMLGMIFVVQKNLHYLERFTQYFGYSAFAFFYSSLLVTVLLKPNGFLSQIFEIKFLTNLGKYSYGLYVFHFGILGLMCKKWEPSTLSLKQSVSMILFSYGVTYLIAYLSWHLFENQFLKMKQYFSTSADGGNQRSVLPG